MLIKILLIPPNKDVIRFITKDGDLGHLPRQHAKHVRVGDICMLEQRDGRTRLRLILDDDPLVLADDPMNKQLVPYYN